MNEISINFYKGKVIVTGICFKCKTRVLKKIGKKKFNKGFDASNNIVSFLKDLEINCPCDKKRKKK